VHANTADGALLRLEALSQGAGSSLSEKALRQQICSAIDIVIQASRFSDGSRRIATIAEVNGFTDTGDYNVRPIYQMSRLIKKPDGKLQGQIEPTGTIPSFMDEIIDNGIPFPQGKFKSVA